MTRRLCVCWLAGCVDEAAAAAAVRPAMTDCNVLLLMHSNIRWVFTLL